MTKPDMATADELAAALETSGPTAVPMDVLSDWLDKLEKSRKLIKLGQAHEKEAKETIQGFLHEHEAQLGLINGMPRVKLSEVTQRRAPSIKYLEETSDDTRAFLKEHVQTTTFETLTILKD